MAKNWLGVREPSLRASFSFPTATAPCIFARLLPLA
jgi:hypothetical protein